MASECNVCHSVCEFVLPNWIKLSDWLEFEVGVTSQFIDKGQGDDSPNFRIFQRYCCDGKSMCKISVFPFTIPKWYLYFYVYHICFNICPRLS